MEASIADELPEISAFDSVQHLSDFFEGGCLGYSDALSGDRYEAPELRLVLCPKPLYGAHRSPLV